MLAIERRLAAGGYGEDNREIDQTRLGLAHGSQYFSMLTWYKWC